MTREEAASTVKGLLSKSNVVAELTLFERQAIRYVAECLLYTPAPRSAWVKTADRLPTEADAGMDECVATVWGGMEEHTGGLDYWKYVARHSDQFIYWLPLPKLPTEDNA